MNSIMKIDEDFLSPILNIIRVFRKLTDYILR